MADINYLYIMKPLNLSEYFTNTTNQLTASHYDCQFKILLNERIIYLICESVKKIIDDSKGIKKNKFDNFSNDKIRLYLLSHRHKYIKNAINNGINYISYNVFTHFYEELLLLNNNNNNITSYSTRLYTFSKKFKANKYKHNSYIDFLAIYKKINKEFENISYLSEKSGDACTLIDIPNIPKITEVITLCYKYTLMTKSIVKYMKALQELIHIEIID